MLRVGMYHNSQFTNQITTEAAIPGSCETFVLALSGRGPDPIGTRPLNANHSKNYLDKSKLLYQTVVVRYTIINRKHFHNPKIMSSAEKSYSLRIVFINCYAECSDSAIEY